MNKKHASVQAQRRAIPPLMSMLLDQYGKERHDGHGAIILYLDKSSIRQIERDWGTRPTAKMSEWFDVYKVVSLDGQTITIGHRYARLPNKPNKARRKLH